jgi:hypothetical protein
LSSVTLLALQEGAPTLTPAKQAQLRTTSCSLVRYAKLPRPNENVINITKKEPPSVAVNLKRMKWPIKSIQKKNLKKKLKN